ncbi:MAG: hypothetical protein GY865_11305 [candidate division Zixibacteria bacterium]|nr:hypothetical protein [candidate division Zixibacteria bacterium]
MKMYINNEKGSAILIALSLITMLTMVGMFAVNTATTDIDLAFNKIHADESFYLAEAGAKRAVYEIQKNANWRTGFSDEQFGGGVYNVVVIDSSVDAALDDTLIILADGWTTNAQANIEITMHTDAFNPFLYSMFGDGSVDIRNSFKTDSYNSDSGSYAATQLDSMGSVGSNGNIIVKNGAFVGGDVVTSLAGGASVNPGATVTGDVADDVPEVDLPLIPQSEFDWADANNSAPAGLSGSYSYDMMSGDLETNGNLVLADGVYFFSSITLKNNSSLTLAPGANVTIYVTGDMEFKNSGSVNPTGEASDLVIYSQGDVVLKNSGDFTGVFYSPEGDADLRNSGEFFGSIIADDIICHNSARFHYDRNLESFSKDGGGSMAVVGWREL